MKKLAGMLVGLAFFLCAVAAQAQPICTLEQALDAPDLSWSTGGTLGGGPGWFCEDTDSYYGGSAAQSYPIPDDNATWFETTITITEQQLLSFYWKVSSDSNDYLNFYIDSSLQSSISGVTTWSQKAFSLSTGTHTLRWEYVKDSSASAGADSAWVDKVEIKNPPITDLLEHYAGMYAVPSIPTPLFAKNTVAKAQPDECYDNGTAGVPDGDGNCTTAGAGRKQTRPMSGALTRSGNLWFGTAANVLCLVMSAFPIDTIEAPNFVCEFEECG